MHLTRFEDAVPYAPPGHHGVTAVRLQGLDAGGPDGCVVSISTYAPDSFVDLLPTAFETIYVVLDGELVIYAHGKVATLRRDDSVHLDRGEVRSIRNVQSSSATLLVVLLSAKPAGGVN
ncbi:hypothetical protein GCM10007304_45420 [Rhodococcoides trifolii]|uniref:Cupin type-2 domain-containing protein n=1 Tax=Rhodococcoides trifolii TaxID=908250 RepID=A0A917G7D6_9NOCA|nr:cupin domain-containing protein [Rhodococcus trifolii]GGG26521.1 hypothetical protein GCM10007304_45420 [Rhodococcus trifolii]